MPADFHTHSDFSDGNFSPARLIKLAVEKSLTSFSLTDHDTVEGISEAIKTAQGTGLKFVVGIELTTYLNSLEIHILGFNFDYKSKKLEEALAPLKKGRHERIYKIIEKLKNQEILLNPEDVFRHVGRGVAGRPHVAQALLAAGYVSSAREAFEKYLKQGASCFVDHEKMEAVAAVNLILDLGGLPILAHPGTSVSDETIKYLIKVGLKGLEAFYPRHSNSQINNYLNLAQQFQLLISGGSDFHGPNSLYPANLGEFSFPNLYEERFLAAIGLA